jgi:hypothetical protein
MPHIFARDWKSCDSNCRPWSVVMVCGQPKQDVQQISRARATVSAVRSTIGMTSGQRVKQSTGMSQYVQPTDVGRGPMRSMWMCRKWAAGGVKLPNGVTVTGDFGALAGLTSTCPAAAILLHAWPYEALCDQLCRCFGARV